MGWAMSDNPDAELAIKALDLAQRVAHPVCCFIPILAANMATGHFGNDCGVIA